jgi:hypothetical protein
MMTETIYITWPNGEKHRLKMSHGAVNKLADYIDNAFWNDEVYSRDVMEAGDLQCGAGDSQCAHREPDGYMNVELKQHDKYHIVYTVEAYVPYYIKNPKDEK